MGMTVTFAQAALHDCEVSGAAVIGIWAHSLSRVTIEDSVANGNFYGFYANAGGVMTLTRSTASFNTYGVSSDGSGSVIYVSNSAITGNTTGVHSFTITSSVLSRGNNTLQGNATNGVFDGSFSAQ